VEQRFFSRSGGEWTEGAYEPDESWERLGRVWSSADQEEEVPITVLPGPFALVSPVGGGPPLQESLCDTWGRFFPTIANDLKESYAYPTPTTEEFWKLYSEPLPDFIEAGLALLGALSEVNGMQPASRRENGGGQLRPTALEGLMEPVGIALVPTPGGWFGQAYRVPSMLGALAAMHAADLMNAGWIKTCARCNAPFTSKSGKAQYCSPACSNAARQQRFRANQKPPASGPGSDQT
jgi:hypothetical protein